MRLLPLALLSLSLTVQADVYRWVDEQGNVVFSDRSRQGAERVELPEISTYEPPRVDPRAWDADGSAADAAPAYTVTFLQPQPDTTVRDSQGDVAAILQLRPPLRPGHRIVLDLDGGARRVELSEPQHLFTGLDRGTHDLEAWVVDSAGERIGEVAHTVFHLHQASRLFTPPGDDDGGAFPRRAPQAPRAPMAPRPPSGLPPGGN